MKLASIRYRGRDIVAAELSPGELVGIASLPRRAGTPVQSFDMLDVIRGGEPLRRHLVESFAKLRTDEAVADHPAFFLKPASCLVGHREPIRVRRYYGSVHPEPELAAIIGRTTRDVSAAEALDAIYGYTIFNDITGNGMRAEDRFHYYAVYAKKDNPNETERVEQHLSYAGRYKGTDTFGAMGPWLVTKDEIANPDDLGVRCKVGGEVIAEDSTRYYNYKVAEVVSFISRFQTLHPGDVISFGTAFQPGAAQRKSIHHSNLQNVDGPIEIAIEGLGVLVNPVVVEEREIGEWRLS
jgi:2-keto-4-pentenoate hydratase/2-oxohepta-3-ene-1,7-dioic acid hydratase in catechol pathway